MVSRCDRAECDLRRSRAATRHRDPMDFRIMDFRIMDFRIKADDGTTRPVEAPFRFGMEEEYFVCEKSSLAPAMTTPDALFACAGSGAASGASLCREMLQAQIEVAT